MPPTADEEAHLLPAQDAPHALPSVPLAPASSSADHRGGAAADNDSDSDSATLGARPSDERRDREALDDVFDDDYSAAAAGPRPQPAAGLFARLRRWGGGGGRHGRASAQRPAAADDDDSEGDDGPAADGEGKAGYRKVRGRDSRRHRERRRRGERGAELVYEMEEGGEASLSPSPDRSGAASDGEVDMAELKQLVGKVKPRRKTSCCQRCLIYTGIVLFFLVMLFAAYGATFATQRPKKVVQLVSNGTSLFAPTTLLISLDGFRADFLNRNLTPTLNGFIREGVSPLYMTPPFPSVTFVSHYTMSTGLYPEIHGIVGNTFWDPELQEEFYYTHPENSMQSKWWGGEPFWVSSELQGAKAAIHMWPGSEAHIGGVDLSFVDPYNADESLDNKVKRVLGWLDLPGPESVDQIAEAPRPQLIVAYVPNVDADGHLYGPNSTAIRKSIKDVDGMLGGMFAGIRERNLTHIVNVIVVSDHGMATSSVDRLIQLDDIIDVSKIEHTDGWPNYGLRPYKDEDVEPLYRQLKAKSEENTAFDVYLRDKDMPPEYHFSNNERIAPLWMIPKTGWAIVQKKDFDVEKAKKEGLVYNPKGIHGYDYRHPLMRAIFVARGPAFPHQPHSRVPSFPNIDVYNIVCDSIGIEPVPNNGTLRLPLKPIGLHSDSGAPVLDTPQDLPEHDVGHASAAAVPEAVSSTTAAAAYGVQTSPPTPETVPGREGDADGYDDDDGPQSKTIWEWLRESLEEIKSRIKGAFGGS